MDPIIAVRGLTKTYATGFVALRGIDLDIRRGEIFALLGPNGAGKSTLIGIVSSLVNASAGTVSIFGVDRFAHREDAMRLLGLVPQEINFNMFEKPFDILVNYAGFYGVPRAEAERRAEEQLKLAQLWEKAQVMSRTLSGGMKRRLMIARAMMTNPRLLILDEPTAGVDIEIRRGMWKTLKEVNARGTTVILTTHYLEEAENLCRNIAIIDRGRIVANGTPAELKGRSDGAGTVVLRVADRGGATLQPLLERVEGCVAVGVVAEEPAVLRLRPKDAPAARQLAARVHELAVREKWKIEELRIEEGRLDDVFRNITLPDGAPGRKP